MSDVNKKIYLLRILHNYTQAYVADQLDISSSAYIAIEQGGSNISICRLEAIIGIYGITLLDFFSFSEDDLMAVLRRGDVPQEVKPIYGQLISKLESLNKILFQLVEHVIDERITKKSS